MSSRIDYLNKGLDNLGYETEKQKASNIQQEKVTSLSTAHEYCTLGKQELSAVNSGMGPLNQSY